MDQRKKLQEKIRKYFELMTTHRKIGAMQLKQCLMENM